MCGYTTRHSVALHHRVPNDFCLDVRRRRVHIRVLYNIIVHSKYLHIVTYVSAFCAFPYQIAVRVRRIYILLYYCTARRVVALRFPRISFADPIGVRYHLQDTSRTRNNNIINNNYNVYYRVWLYTVQDYYNIFVLSNETEVLPAIGRSRRAVPRKWKSKKENE